MSHYETLGISKTATLNEIKKAYRELTMQYHPDRPQGDANKFREIAVAYKILSVAEDRWVYDRESSFKQMSSDIETKTYQPKDYKPRDTKKSDWSKWSVKKDVIESILWEMKRDEYIKTHGYNEPMPNDPTRCQHQIFVSVGVWRQCTKENGYGENLNYCKDHVAK